MNMVKAFGKWWDLDNSNEESELIELDLLYTQYPDAMDEHDAHVQQHPESYFDYHSCLTVSSL